MRYCQKISVDRVQNHLVAIGVDCHVSALHTFVRRVLTLLPADLALLYQIDVRLLKAIRRRLQLPLQPARRKSTSRRALPRFACVGALPAVRPRRPAKARPPGPKQTINPRDSFGPVPTLAPPAVRTEEIVPPGRQPTLPQWKIIYAQALRKLPDNAYPAEEGFFDIHTKRPISKASLVADYGLSKQEAESLFMTL